MSFEGPEASLLFVVEWHVQDLNDLRPAISMKHLPPVPRFNGAPTPTFPQQSKTSPPERASTAVVERGSAPFRTQYTLRLRHAAYHLTSICLLAGVIYNVRFYVTFILLTR